MYYVFEYFIRATDEVFYVGRGYMDNDFKYPPHPLVTQILDTFDTGRRVVEDYLDYDSSKELQARLLVEYSHKGYKLANVQMPLGTGSKGGFYVSYQFQYMVRPPMILSDFDRHYFGEYDNWDTLDPAFLVNTCYNPNSRVSLEYPVYLKESTGMSVQRVSEIEAKISEQLQDLLSTKLSQKVRVYKTPSAKAVQSVTFSHTPTRITADKLRAEGKKLYHLVDVLKYLGTEASAFY